MYKSGIYNNDFFPMFKGELMVMNLFHQKTQMSVYDILDIIYPELCERDEDIVKLTEKGQNKFKLLELIDQNLFEQMPESTVIDDFDTFRIPLTSGLSISVDAVYQSKESCNLLLT